MNIRIRVLLISIFTMMVNIAWSVNIGLPLPDKGLSYKGEASTGTKFEGVVPGNIAITSDFGPRNSTRLPLRLKIRG